MNAQILRNLIMRYGARIGVPKEIRELIWHVTDHDFRSNGFSYPGQKRLAERMGYSSVESIRKIAKKAHDQGWLLVFPGKGQGNATRYHITEKLVRELQPHFKEEAKNAVDKFNEEPPTLFGINPYDGSTKPLPKFDQTPTPIGGNTINNTAKKTKKEEKRVFYSEFVQMKPKQYKKLIEVYGKVKTLEMIFELDLAIPNQIRKPYKDHYRAILKWVVEECKAVPLKGKSANPLYKPAVQKKPQPEAEPATPEERSKFIAEARDNMASAKAKRFKEMADNKNRTNEPKSMGDILK